MGAVPDDQVATTSGCKSDHRVLALHRATKGPASLWEPQRVMVRPMRVGHIAVRRCAVVLAVLLLASCGGTSADPPLADSAAEQDLGGVDPAAAFLMQDLGIDAAEAERRLKLQEQTPALEADLRARFPETFAGLWIDQAGGGTVTIATKGGDPAVVKLASGRGFDATSVSVTWSSAELEATAGRLRPGAAALGLGIGVDTRSNQVLIMRPPDVSAESVSALLAAEPPGLVRIEQGRDTTG